jgi:F-type H+-transporting ATPase subunit b
MSFDWTTFAFQIVNVLVLLAILTHFLFRPVAGIIQKRQAETDAAIARAEATQAEAKAATERARAEAEANAAARRDVLAKAQDEAMAERARLVEDARAEAAKLVKAAQAEADDLVAKSEARTLARARDLAEMIAARAFAAQPRPPTSAGYAERLAEAVTALPDNSRTAMFGSGSLTLVSAQPLSDADMAAVQAAMASIPGLGSMKPEVVVDPTLIAGLDLRAASGVVRNSLAHDLARIAEALDGDGSGS